MSTLRSIFIFSGEPSADMHGALLAEALHAQNPSLKIYAVGGPRLQEAGVELFRTNADLALVGFWEVVKHYWKFKKLLEDVLAFIQEKSVELVILIDYPGFNLRLAERLHTLKVKVVYYISPQLWAWGKDRMNDIRKTVDHMIVIFDFERTLYEKAKIPVTFVGHPLMDTFEEHVNTEALNVFLNRKSGDPLIAFLPGSREAEVKRLVPIFLKTLARLRKEIPDFQFVFSAASKERSDQIQKICKDFWELYGVEPPPIFFGDVKQIMKESFALIVKSGTATLESALYTTPMVVVYRVNSISYWIIKVLIQIKNISLVNVISGRKTIPELIQSDCNPSRIVQEILQYKNNTQRYSEVKEALLAVKEKLGVPGASVRAAQSILKVLDEKIS
jgi:lipid-A-disaccharide synthase